MLVMLSGMIGTDNVLMLVAFADDEPVETTGESLPADDDGNVIGEETEETAAPEPADETEPQAAAEEEKAVPQPTETPEITTEPGTGTEEPSELPTEDAAGESKSETEPEGPKDEDVPALAERKIEHIQIIPNLEMALSGQLPTDASVGLKETEYQFKDTLGTLLYKGELQVFYGSGDVFQPDGIVTVEIKGELIRSAISEGRTIGLIVDERNTEAKLVKAENDTLTFQLTKIDLFVLYVKAAETEDPKKGEEPDKESDEYVFQAETVKLTDILTALSIELTQNNYNVSVDSDAVKLSAVKVNKNGLAAFTLTALRSFSDVTLSLVSSNGKDAHSISLSYAVPVFNYAFTGLDDSVMLLSLLRENGVKTVAVDDASVAEGDEANVELLDYIGDYLVAPNKYFDRAVITAITREGKTYEIVISCVAVVEEQTIPASAGEATVTLAGLLPSGAEVAVTEIETPDGIEAEDSVSFDITISGDFQPEEPITVTVSDPKIREMAEAGMQILVVHVADDGTLEPIRPLEVKGDTITFMADHFSRFNIGGYLFGILTSWMTEAFHIAICGLSGLTANYSSTSVVVEEGLEVIGAWNVSSSGLLSSLSGLRIDMTERISIDLLERESLDVYAVNNGQLDHVLASNIAQEESVELGSAKGFALVRDSGYRQKSVTLDNVSLDGMMPKDVSAEAEDASENTTVQMLDGELLAAYEINLSSEGTEYQPDAGHPVEVTINVAGVTATNADNIELWHIRDDGTSEKMEGFTVENGKVSFVATSFSMYAVVETKLTETVDASDGNTYEIVVTYKNTSGIPMKGTALLVSELKPGDEGYDEYVAASAAKVGTKTENIELSRVFDIRIVNESDHSTIYEPAGDVEVSIRLVGETLDDYANIDVLHFVEDDNTDGFTVYDLDSAVNGESVRFTTDSFSVYAVVGTVHVRTFYFYTFDEYLDYVPYYLNTDVGTDESQTYMQIVREGETPVAPQNPINPQDQEAAFSGWYQGSANTADGPTATVPYTFSAVPELSEDDSVYLYAKFSRYIYVVFHDQHDAGSNSFPVAFTRRIDLNSEGDWYVDVTQYSVSYEDPNELDDTAMVFVGWSEAPITKPGAALNDDGDTVTQVNTQNGQLWATQTTHLYPIFAPVKWISFYSGPSGSHATYFTDTYYLNGIGPENLPGRDGRPAMTRDGNYEFAGWYINASLDSNGEVDITGATKVADADGVLNTGATDEEKGKLTAAGITFENTAAEGETPSWRIKLTGNVTLYAYWTAKTTANYTVVIVKQNATDETGINESNKTYSYSESFTLSGTIGDTLQATDSRFEHYRKLNTNGSYNALHDPDLGEGDVNPYANYTLSTSRTDSGEGSSTEIDANGSSILYFRYNWITKPSISDKFTLRFVDPMAEPEYAIKEYVAGETEGTPYDDRVPYSETLSTYVPPDPTSTVSRAGLIFNGWYADRACTTRAIFHAGSTANDLTDEEKASLAIKENGVTTGYKPYVFFASMPAADMTFYAGWTRQWFLIKIDPNYGELYKHVYTDDTQTAYRIEEGDPVFTGTGSTWFWKEYGDTFQEYTTIRRDYVESDSGSWYYVKHDRDYYGYPDGWISDESGERKAYYTKDLGEATEFTTFEHEEGVYRYAGWYEVLYDENGNEIGEADSRYDFSKIVDHNITLRMRWQKVGAFYLQYDAGLGTLNRDEENEKLYLELDGDSYADDADVLITRSAKAPVSYEFVGWRIRGDESGTVYRAGQTFHLLSQYMATVQGKRTVFLDAVYQQVPTATIVYHANGGTVAGGITESSIHYGGYPTGSDFSDTSLVKSADLGAGTATVSHIVNNSEFVLSDGSTWLCMNNATFAGWCENSVYDPDDADHPLLKTDASQSYRVGANAGETAEDQTVHLYAIWQVDVKFHLNKSADNANFGGTWDSSVYTLYGDTYTQSNVYVGSTLSWPTHDPVWTGSESKSFLGWATRTGDSEPYTYNTFDFSQPVTGALDLYALWGDAPICNVKVVDSSDYPTIAAAPWVDSDNNGTPDGSATITLTSARQAPSVLATAITSDADAYNNVHSTTYAFSFATVLGESVDMQYLQEKRIEQIYYSPQDGKTHLIYGSGTDARDVALGENEQLCFVYYQVRTPDIGYLLMEISGDVKPINNMDSDAPTSTAGLGVTISADTIFTISSTYQPMTWLPETVTETINKQAITHYNFAIGAPGATNSVDLHHKTQAYTGNETGADARPELYIKNTWRGLQFSQDGTNYFNADAESKLYVVFYTEMPTVVTLYNSTVGLAADMDTQFTYDYWIEEIPLNNGVPNYEMPTLVFTTRDPRTPYSQQLAAGDTYSALTFTSTAHTYRVTFVLTPKDGFTPTVPHSLPTVDGCNAPATTIPSWVGNSSATDSQSNNYHSNAVDSGNAFSYTVLEGDGYCGKTALIQFTNRRETVNVDLHVAKADLNGILYHAPEWRVAATGSSTVWDPANKYTVPLSLGEMKSLFEGYTYDKFTHNVDSNYKPGALIYGMDHHTSASHNDSSGDNDQITLDENASLGCFKLAYELVDPANPNVYNLYMKDGGDYRYPLDGLAEQIAHNINGVTHPDDNTLFYRLFYLFYPAVTVYYVVENADGSLSPVKGSTDGTTESETITYNGEQAKLNSHYNGMQADLNTEIVQQGQKVGIWTQSLEISQKVGDDANGNPIFNIPPLLDNGTHKLDLIYYKLGASTQADPATPHTNISAFPGTKDNGYIDPGTNSVYSSGVTEELVLHIGITDHRLQWRFVDEPAPQVLDNWPVVYAIYRERGYNLTVTKTVTVDTGYTEPYTVTITSPSINRDKYTVTGTGYSTISAVPAQLNGSDLVEGTGVITFEVKDGDSVTIHGLIPGTYTVSETGNENDTLSAKTITDASQATETDLTVTDNSTVSVNLQANTELRLTNAPKAICRVGSIEFHTLSSAVEYISAHSSTMTGTIEMLMDYLMPASDTPVIPAYLSVALTTANNYNGSGTTATITRKGNVTGPMISNLGTFTLGNVCLYGNNVSGSAMISNEGTLTLGGDISVTNLTTTTTQGEGGEVTTTTATAGTQTNTSPVLKDAKGNKNGGAIYSLKGTVNMVGGTIRACSATSGGAIYAAAGAVNISGGNIQDNSATECGAIYYAGSDTVTISGGTIGADGHANKAQNGGALYMASGTADITGGTISYNTASQSGGAIYALNAYVNVNGNSASIDHNTAAVNGGAVHMETLTFKLIKGSITNNSAADGGAIWAGTGTVELSGGSMSNNSATGVSTTTTDPDTGVETTTTTGGSGGAVYAESSAFVMTGGTLSSNTANENGGAVYAESGSINVKNSGSQVKNNTATNGSGGGVYAGSGSVTMSSSAKLYGNAATSGNGGALYVGSGTASLNAVTIGDKTSGNANQAINGSGVFVNSGTLSITDGSIGGNVASNGGAVGVGSADARLNFYNGLKITGNTMTVSGGEPVASNVYLNYDTDAILNFQTLNNQANVGIYVSDDVLNEGTKDQTTVLAQRGVPNTRFGVYVNTNVVSNMGKIINDRTGNLTVRNETTNKKLYWVRDFNVKVYYVASYADGLPFGNTDYTNSFATSGGNFKKQLDETPPKEDSAISDVAADVRTKDGVNLPASAVFGNAFVQGSSASSMSYTEYLTDIKWNTTDNRWEFVKRDRNSVPGNDTNTKENLIFIYTEPYYLSIENNAKDDSNHGLTLDISALTVTVNGTAQSVIDNYGYVYAKNDEIQNALRPVQASDLVLAYGESIRILLPGGKNMAYALTGTYYSAYDPANSSNNVPASGTVEYKQRVTPDSTPTQTGTGNVDASAAFAVNGTTPSTAGQTHQLIFGGDRAICKLVVSARIADTSTTSGYVESGFVDEHAGEENTAGKYEYTFNSPRQANDFIMAHHDAFTSGTTVTATIEMLMDYMIPASEQVSLSTGNDLVRNITFQTAVDGYFRYDSENTKADGTGTHPRATISRASGNLSSFIAAPNGTLSGGDYVDKLTVKNLIFDGKNFGGDTIEGGIIKTKGWNVEISNADFRNCRARYGGGIFIESVWPKKDDQTPYGHLTVTDSHFTNCQSLEGTDKFGGGGIWTSMREMTLTGCSFDSCRGDATIGNSKNAQGGGAFHFVANINVNIETKSTVTNCTFENCSANAGGSMECGAKTVRITGCIFRNSTAKTKNSGAFNVWVYDSSNSSNKSYVYVDNCTFENCYCITVSNGNGNGGAFRSTATYNTVTNCTFTNTTGAKGGAINITNDKAVDTFVSGCSFNGCTAVQEGGAIYCMSKTLTIDSVNHDSESGGYNQQTLNDTLIRNCTAVNEGGAVYHGNKNTAAIFSVTNATIDTCYSSTKGGGGVYTMAPKVSITDSIVQNCSTLAENQNGGGMYLERSTNTILSGTVIQNCTATDFGGGVFQGEYYENNTLKTVNGSFTITNGSSISGNNAQGTVEATSNNVTYQVSGGGIYTRAKTFTLQNSSVTDNQGLGSGGGICQNYNGNDGSMTVDGATVTGNICGGYGGGLFTLTNMTLKGITTITGNRLTTYSDTAENAAGVYLRNGVTLSLGVAGHTGTTVNGVTTYPDTFDITGNLTVDGTLSDLRLPDGTVNGEIVNANNVKVYCGIGGEIRVVNAKKKLTQFGTAQGLLVNPAGFTDEHKVFWADDGSLYGIVDRQDPNGKKIIWGGDPICKITDGNNRPLYIDAAHIRPAVFDRLDSGNNNDKSTTSAFSTLRGLDSGETTLYYVDGTSYTGSDYKVQMLVENYTAEYYIIATGGTGRNVTLTTARTTDSVYPYRGREGTRCTILRDPRMNTGNPMITAQTNLALTNIVLDGGSENGVTANNNTRIIKADGGTNTPIQITLGRNATLQNAEVTGTLANNKADGKGGGVYLNNGAKLAVTGGAIRNCAAVDGGGVYIDGGAGTFTMSVGTITRCTASGNGGGVYFNKGTLTNDGSAGFMRITGGSITRCSAQNGGGVYLNGNNGSRTLYMSGGSIASNHADNKGGGVFVGDANVRIYFSGAPYVHGSTSDISVASDKACNVEMDQTFDRSALNPSTVIVSSGLNRGAKIGVYVPGEDGGSGALSTLYDKHGAEMDPFATFTDGNERGLNYFLNDRNGMKGGRLDNPNGSDYKIYWRIIYALSVKKQVLSDDPADMTSYRFRLTLSGEIPNADGTKTPASEINGIYGDMTFTGGVANFTLTNGQTKSADLLPLGFSYRVEELLNVEELAHFHTSVENWDGTVSSLTSVSGEMNTQSHFNYLVTFSNLHAICKLTDQQGHLLYTYNSDSATYVPAVYSSLVTAFNKVNAGNDNHWFSLGDDGQYYNDNPSSYQIQMLVPECELEDMASLMNGRTALLTTADRNADDGFPYVGGDTTAKITRDYTGDSMITVSSGSLTLGNITLDGDGTGHPVSCNGDILNIAPGSSLTVGTGATLKNATTSGNGAAVYLAQGSTMNISGAPVFSNNVKTGAVSGTPKNGNDATFYSGTTAPQDIYLAGYTGTTANSLVVTGDIDVGTIGQGSITVWAAENPHYVQNRQFAVMSGGTWTGLDAFRNAQPDTTTENPLKNEEGTPKYLYGIARDGKVFWSGSMDLTVSKTVTGELADPTESFNFTVTFTGLDDGYKCDFAIYGFDGTDWIALKGNENSGKKTVSNGTITFSLTHNQKIVISVPRGVNVTITETDSGFGEPSYVIDSAPSVSGSVTGAVAMNTDTSVAFTNHFPAVAPTGVFSNTTPFGMLFLFGAFLAAWLFFSWLIKKRHCKDDDPDPEGGESSGIRFPGGVPPSGTPPDARAAAPPGKAPVGDGPYGQSRAAREIGKRARERILSQVILTRIRGWPLARGDPGDLPRCRNGPFPQGGIS